MSKRKKRKRAKRTNPVAKFSDRINKPKVHRDRKNEYKRKSKHASTDHE